MTVPRTAFAADKTGFFMMSALYDSLLAFPNIDILHEHYATDLVLKGGAFRGFLTLELATGQPRYFAAKAGIIATGGFARMYGFTTTAYSSTGDGIALAYKAGLPLKDMEFVQFHPTGLIPTGVLITEAARGEGGYLVDSQNRRFMEDYAKSKMELAPRDIVSRAMITELGKGHGLLHEVSGMTHLLLDLRHLGEEKIDERLPMIKEIAMKLLGINPAHDPLPGAPRGALHHGRHPRELPGAGDEGRLLHAGGRALGRGGVRVRERPRRQPAGQQFPQPLRHLGQDHGGGGGPPRHGHEERPRCRGGEGGSGCRLRPAGSAPGPDGPGGSLPAPPRALGDHGRLRARVPRRGRACRRPRRPSPRCVNVSAEVGVSDPSEVFNTNLRDVLEIGSMLELAQAVAAGALMRKESRGSHARVEYPARDDVNFLKHTLAYRTEGLPRLSYIPVARTRWEPMERKY